MAASTNKAEARKQIRDAIDLTLINNITQTSNNLNELKTQLEAVIVEFSTEVLEIYKKYLQVYSKHLKLTIDFNNSIEQNKISQQYISFCKYYAYLKFLSESPRPTIDRAYVNGIITEFINNIRNIFNNANEASLINDTTYAIVDENFMNTIATEFNRIINDNFNNVP